MRLMLGPEKCPGTKLLIAIPILIAILVSGCITPGGPSAGGVEIVDFHPDFPEIYPGETVKFNLMVKNTGSVEATDVFAELLGLDEDWFGGREQFPNEAECRYDGNFFTLMPPRPEHGTGGETHVCTWNYGAPEDIPRGTSISYDATARVFYTYHTDVVKTVTLVSYNKMREIIQQGGSLVMDAVSQTSSPISITASTRSPIRLSESQDSMTFPLEIGIENVGGGIACRVGACKKQLGEKWNEVLLKIEFPSDGIGIVQGTGCSGFSGDGEFVSVWLGKPNRIACDLEVKNPSSITGPVQIPIRIHAEYSYFVDKTISIRVSSPY
jgi:hypothetical protein